MTPIFYTLTNNKHLMIIPDTLAHLDGNAIINYAYSITLTKKTEVHTLGVKIEAADLAVHVEEKEAENDVDSLPKQHNFDRK
jgi:hypothetical protein